MSAQLSAADRKFFSLVADAAFANPFGSERESLDSEIAEHPGDDPEWLTRMLAKVDARLTALAHGKKVDVRAFSGTDRELIEHSVLFEAFHRFVTPLDHLIESQDRAGDTALRVPFAEDFLQHLSARGLAAEQARRMFELSYQMRRAYSFITGGLIGKSTCMRKLREQLWQAVFTRDIRGYERYLWNRMEDFSTLLLGETGTGKGAAALAIGLSGFIPFDEKKQQFAYGFRRAFVPIHLNEFPDTLFESEIFGHRKGSFTGAIDNHDGVLSRCSEHGTVFFDEIGEATLPVQVKLLRVLQDRVYSPVGERTPRRFHGRIVAATHRSLAELRRNGEMRDDFFYRLCSNVIEVPPLRARIAEDPSELPELVAHLCARITGTRAPELAEHVSAVLERDLGEHYAFSGNVRELEQCVRRVLVSGACRPDDKQTPPAADDLASTLQAGGLTADALVARYCSLLYERTSSYVEVARLTGLDRRTVKKHVER